MKPILPLLSAFVIFISALIVLFTPLRPQISFVNPELKLIPTSAPVLENWQIFQNDKFGFELKYPSDYFVYHISVPGIDTLLIGKDEKHISFSLYSNLDSRLFFASKDYQISDYKIDGLDTYIKSDNQNNLYFLKNNVLFMVKLENDSISSQILSTVKFSP